MNRSVPAEPPLKAVIIPVTPLQQNCTLLWCTVTMRGAFVDPGGDIDKLVGAAEANGVTIEKILLTHGHIDHCGLAKPLADRLGVPIEGPERRDAFWIDRLDEDGARYGIRGVPFVPDRWLDEGDPVTVGDLSFDVYYTPGHTPGHIVFHHPASKLALVGDVLFEGSVGRTDFPGSDPAALIRSVVTKLWPLGSDARSDAQGDTTFIPGHGNPSTFARERATNPFVGDAALRRHA